MIPNLDLRKLDQRDPVMLEQLREAVHEVGFLTISNTGLDADRIQAVMQAYRAFFKQPEREKAKVDMARTGSNRGWGGPRSEQVDPDANPDYKEVFDCGQELAPNDPWVGRDLSVYAPNLWPADDAAFRETIEGYFRDASAVAMRVLRAIAAAIGNDPGAFDTAFERPMALLRGNFYPESPNWAGDRDFGIAAHSDYGCLTLLATDGVPGLEAKMPDGAWQQVDATPGVFVINFGEMLQFWTGGRIKATLHRVKGSAQERISVPLFFNPSFDANVAPPGSGQVITAGEHLTRRYDETYVHLQKAG